MAERASAAELRAYNMRSFLMEEYTGIADHVRAALLAVARRQTMVRAAGDAASGLVTVATYIALGALPGYPGDAVPSPVFLFGGLATAVAAAVVLALRIRSRLTT